MPRLIWFLKYGMNKFLQPHGLTSVAETFDTQPRIGISSLSAKLLDATWQPSWLRVYIYSKEIPIRGHYTQNKVTFEFLAVNMDHYSSYMPMHHLWQWRLV